MRMERMVWVWMFCGSSGGVVYCWHDMIEADFDGKQQTGHGGGREERIRG